MKVARILYPIHSLGPGKRLCIWVCGCERRCFRCANPELQYADPEKEIDLRLLLDLITPQLCEADGVTISGGEPFDQVEELSQLVDAVRVYTTDILIFTGYTRTALEKRDDFATNHVLESIAVLIDGEYIDQQNNGEALRGSSNQQIHYLSEKYRESYEPYLQAGRMVQNVATSSGVFSIGIHSRGFLPELHKRVLDKLRHGNER